MSILKIRKEGDPILRTKAGKVDQITDKTLNLIENMKTTMLHEEGVGLAAPQVGVSRRIIVIRQNEQDVLVVINPEITNSAGKAIGEEGCLSIPEKSGLVARAEEITVTGLNSQGEEKTLQATGMLARVFQHEIDHLNGVLFTDKLIQLQQEQQEPGI